MRSLLVQLLLCLNLFLWSKSQHKLNYGNGDFVGARFYLDKNPIRVEGDVDSMWESFKKYVIEVRDRHIPLMRIGAKKWKSEYPAGMGIMQLIKVKTKRHWEWLVYQFTYSASSKLGIKQ